LLTVLGADRTFLEYFNVNIQYFYKHVYRLRQPFSFADRCSMAPPRRSESSTWSSHANVNGVAVRLKNEWLNETFTGEAIALYAVGNGYGLRAKLDYALSDRWKVSAGGDEYGGAADGLFGRLAANRIFFAELRYQF